MLTLWCVPLPECIAELDDLIVCNLQKEITTNGKIHWQAFVQFSEEKTVAALKWFFDHHGLKDRVHIGGKDITETHKSAVKGLRYVTGYGPLALSKLLDPQMRYIIKPNEIIQNEVPIDRLDDWSRLSANTRYIAQMVENQRVAIRILRLGMSKSEDSIFHIRATENIKKRIENWEAEHN